MWILSTPYPNSYKLFSRLDFTAPENENSVEILESLAALSELVQPLQMGKCVMSEFPMRLLGE